MKKLIRLSALMLLALPVAFNSCKKDEVIPPAPQITSSQSTINTVPEATSKVTLTISAPGNLATVTAVADQGTVTVGTITGVGTTTGSVELTYVAPLAIGTYKITATATDDRKQTVNLDLTVAVTAKPPVTVPAGNVEGTWEKGTTYTVTGNITIAVGKTLTIQEGVTVIFDGDGTATAPQLTVAGNLYSLGTKDRPNKFTIPEAKRTKANIFAGLWGGIQCTVDAAEVALIYTSIEFGGAPVGAGNPLLPTATVSYPYSSTDPRYGFLFTNPNGKLVIQNSRIAYTKDDGMRVTGGTILLSNNTFELNGQTGGEAINIKSSVVGDIAYNLAYRSATNGFKTSNKSGTAANPQSDVNIYNNTSIECGWRQTKTGRGGSLNLEENVRGQVYNNLMVNCKFGVRIVTTADVTNIKQGFNGFYATEQIMVDQFYVPGNAVNKGDKETTSDVVGAKGENDPKFVNYTVSSFVSASNTDPAVQDFMGTKDFRLATGSSFLAKGKTGFTPKNTSLTLGGKTYTVPAPANYIGAFGSN